MTLEYTDIVTECIFNAFILYYFVSIFDSKNQKCSEVLNNENDGLNIIKQIDSDYLQIDNQNNLVMVFDLKNDDDLTINSNISDDIVMGTLPVSADVESLKYNKKLFYTRDSLNSSFVSIQDSVDIEQERLNINKQPTFFDIVERSLDGADVDALIQIKNRLDNLIIPIQKNRSADLSSIEMRLSSALSRENE